MKKKIKHKKIIKKKMVKKAKTKKIVKKKVVKKAKKVTKKVSKKVRPNKTFFSGETSRLFPAPPGRSAC